MINEGPLQLFEPLGARLLKPIYRDYSFANIPTTIHYLLTGERIGPLLPAACFGGTYPKPEKVVLFFIDSFGWKFWTGHQDRFAPMRQVAKSGTVTPISALFPSTTSASVTTMNLGVLPAQHALYEWNMYVPAYGETIQSLPFMPLGRHYGDACLDRGFDPAALMVPHRTMHQRLADRGVRSIQLAHKSYAGSSYNRIASAGAELVPYGTLAEAMTRVRHALEDTASKIWINLYWADIDSIAHLHGPESDFHAAEIGNFWATFQHVLGGSRPKNTLFLFTADHGQVACPAQETIYINVAIPELADCLAESPTGSVILPNGSPRDMFLHVKPDRRAEALERLTTRLAGIALVMTTDAAITEGLLGPPGSINPELRRRLGDILVLPYDGHFVFWYERGRMGNAFHGHHGGLAPAELISVLGVVDGL